MSGRIGNDEGQQRQDHADVEQPDRQRIDAREGDVLGADHQRDAEVGEETGQRRNLEAEDHHRTVGVEPDVVLGRIGGDGRADGRQLARISSAMMPATAKAASEPIR
jgi:hypothetical protein